jgi:hypothetical protein
MKTPSGPPTAAAPHERNADRPERAMLIIHHLGRSQSERIRAMAKADPDLTPMLT